MTVTVEPFLHGHATHPDWRMALALCAAQIDGQRSLHEAPPEPTLGWVYFSEQYLHEAESLLEALRERWPEAEWVGGCGAGVLACGAEYRDEPALSVMVACLDPSLFRVFSGQRPLGSFRAGTLQVHADLLAPDLPELLRELGERSVNRRMFGGVVFGRRRGTQIAGAALSGGLSGVALHERLPVLTRVAQGCRPLGPTRRITRAERNQVLTLDGRPALDCLLEDMGVSEGDLKAVAPRLREMLAGVVPADTRHRRMASDPAMQVRRLVGVTAGRGAVALAEDFDAWPHDDGGDLGAGLVFCQVDTEQARSDLVRACSEIRDELLSDDEAWRMSQGCHESAQDQDPALSWLRSRIAGAVYVSCASRGGDRFGGQWSELETVRRALGDVPLVGLYAMAEIADEQLHSYSGVLSVFLREEVAP